MISQTDQNMNIQMTKSRNHLVKQFTTANVSDNVLLHKRQDVNAWSNTCPHCTVWVLGLGQKYIVIIYITGLCLSVLLRSHYNKFNSWCYMHQRIWGSFNTMIIWKWDVVLCVNFYFRDISLAMRGGDYHFRQNLPVIFGDPPIKLV